MLEARDVPAVLYWNPLSSSDLSASNGDNWRVGTPTGMTHGYTPGVNDDLYFAAIPVASGGGLGGGGTSPPPPPISWDCVFGSSSGSQFASIHLAGDYEGTVTFEHNINVGGFEQFNGDIDQTAPNQMSALSLTVNPSLYAGTGVDTGMFVWAGGDLNNGENVGVVNIVGITNARIGQTSVTTVAPLVDSLLTSGSAINLQASGSVGGALSTWGTIVLNNAANFVVGVNCLHIDPTEGISIDGKWGTRVKKGAAG